MFAISEEIQSPSSYLKLSLDTFGSLSALITSNRLEMELFVPVSVKLVILVQGFSNNLSQKDCSSYNVKLDRFGKIDHSGSTLTDVKKSVSASSRGLPRFRCISVGH